MLARSCGRRGWGQTLFGRDKQNSVFTSQYAHEAWGHLTVLAGIVTASRRRVECNSKFPKPYLRFHRRGDVAMRAFGGYVLLFALLALSLVVLGWLVLIGLRWL
jgi:hypothetical protein